MTEGNSTKWKGGDENNAKTKNTHASELVTVIHEHVVRGKHSWFGKDT